MHTRTHISLQRNLLQLFCPMMIAMAVALGPYQTHAQVNIKAVVNSQVITSVEVAERARILQLTREARGNTQKQALEELIDESVRNQEAARWRVRVSSNEVDAVYANVARSVKLDLKTFGQVLAQNGVNPKSFKQRIRGQITWTRLVQAKVRADVAKNRITVGGIEADTPPAEGLIDEFDLAEIIFVVPRRQSGTRKAQLDGANALSRSGIGCDNLSSLHSKKNVVVKRLGRRSSDVVPPPIADQLSKLTPGQATKPFPNDAGFTVFVLCGKGDVARRLTGAGVPSLGGNDTPTNEQAQRVAKNFSSQLRAQAIIEYR